MKLRTSALSLFLLVAGGCKSAPTLVTVEVPEGVTRSEFSVYQDKKPIIEIGYAGKPVEIPPGTYTITRNGSMRWIWARDVKVARGRTTTVRLGAMKVVTPGVDESISVLDPATNRFVSELDPVNVAFAAPAGTWRPTSYLESTMQFDDVKVEAGKVSELQLGAIKVTVPEGTYDDAVSVYDETGKTRSERRPIGKPFLAPTGRNRLNSFLDITVLAEAVEVTPGRIVDVPVGALVWNGAPPPVSLYTPAGKLAKRDTLEKGRQIAVGVGEWRVGVDARIEESMTTVTVTPGAIAVVN